MGARVNEQQFAFPVDGEQAQRLDKFLVACLPDYSRTRLQGLIKDGFVTVDDRLALKSGLVIEPGSMVQVRLPPTVPAQLEAQAIPLDIVFENLDLLVVNKPAGMVVHPAVGHTAGTLVNAALAHAPEMEGIGGQTRPGVVHRLDKDTSGLILLAKNERAQRWLQDQFRLRKVDKIYLALVDGRPPTPTGRVEVAIGRDPSLRKQMAVVPDHKGRPAISEYLTLESFPEHTLLEVHPYTGRTHQIRLHMQFLGCPVVGDTLYGRKRPSLPLPRHFLHAARLTIQLPSETKPRTFVAALPAELQALLEQLRHTTALNKR
jgi:23S rRNA pseudouridine1911/1915/1917 synthase